MPKHQPNWTKYILGPNLSSDPSSHHSSIRAYVIEYLLTCCFWLRIFISLSVLTYLINHEGFVRVEPYILFLGFTLIWSYSSDFMDYAAALWISFSHSEEIDESEFMLIENRVKLLYFFNSGLVYLNVCFTIIILTLLIIKIGWIMGILIFGGILVVSTMTGLLLHFYFCSRFLKRLRNRADYFLVLYNIYWRKDSEKNSFLELTISNGDLIFTLFLAMLFTIRFLFQPTPIFTVFFMGVNAGLLFLIMLRRKLIVAPPSKYFRKPFLPLFSKWVSKHLSQSLFYDSVWIFCLGSIVVELFPNLLRDWSTWWWISIPIQFAMVFCSRFFLANGTIRIFKRIIDNQFNIIIFRRFSETYAQQIKKIIYPNLGAYGRITSVQDATLNAADSSFNRDSEAVLGEYSSLIYLTEQNWKAHIVMNLRSADLIVFCLLETITQSMEWEFDQTIGICHPSRIIIIVSKNSDYVVQKWLEKKSSFVINATNYIVLTDNSYQTFGNKLYSFFKNLKLLKREVQPVIKFPDLAENFADSSYYEILGSGAIVDSEYHNTYFGLFFQIPQKWYILSESEMDAQESAGKKMLLSAGNKPIGERYNLEPKFLISIYKYPSSSPNALTDNCGFQIRFIKKEHLKGYPMKLYFEALLYGLTKLKGLGFDNATSIEKISIAGNHFLTFGFEEKIQEFKSFHRSYILEVNDAFLLFDTYCRDKSLWVDIRNIFLSLTIKA